MSQPDFDVAVVGSGFAGTLTALIARQLGLRVALIERGRHPRFVIGESSTPLADILWIELVQRYDLPRLAPLAKWGPWQRELPHLPCGLKRGFTFFYHRAGEPFQDDDARSGQLLVAASSRDETADTHWYRPAFDAYLVGQALAAGVEYLDQTKLSTVAFSPAAATVTGSRLGRPAQLSARFLVDASGPRGFLFRQLGLAEAEAVHAVPTQSLYAHFRGVHRLDELGIPAGAEQAPYPPDDAALHHVFDGGWVWVLRFNHGLVSAGVAATDDLAARLNLSDGAPAWERLLNRFPTLRRQFAQAEPVTAFFHSPRLAFAAAQITGPRWALLPYAAGFVDPLLSTGFPLSLLGIRRLANSLEHGLDAPGFSDGLARYAAATAAELSAAQRLIGSLYATMNDFDCFRDLTLLYFAAAAYSEISRRLGRAELAGGFLLHDHPRFGPAARAACEFAWATRPPHKRSGEERRRLRQLVRDTIGPVDATGLDRAERRHWYPVEAADLIAAAGKFGLTGCEMEAWANG
ncbi:MAG: tryptophan 7-halogenase [Verrucomicrobia bacterium]|nr:tryptophan 7-halogenase [Verrucomicrobiota bacterium]